MKKSEVPQDANPAYGRERRALYAVDEAGHYTTVPSAGWRADEIVNAQAVEDFAQRAQLALERARAGAASALDVHMYRQRMDVETLAQATGLWRWRVRRHLRPGAFARLSPALRARYAEALGVAGAALDVVPTT